MRRTRNGQLVRCFAAAAALIACHAVALAGSIRLRESITLAPGEPPTLGRIAEIDGADAAAFAGLSITGAPCSSAASTSQINLDDVRAALKAAGAPMSRLALSGKTCAIRFEEARPAPLASPREPAINDAPTSPDTGARTVRGAVARMLARLYGVAPEDLRARFDPADTEFLDQPEAGRRIIVEPQSSDHSAKAILAVRIVADASIADARTIRADIELREQVLIASRSIARRRPLQAADFAAEARWLAPEPGEIVASLDAFEDAVSRSRIDQGSVLRREHIEPAIVIKRNELVTVHCIASGIEVKTKARAKADARIGDHIEFRIDGAKRGFTARVDGPGIAIMEADGGGPPRAVTETSRDEEHAP